MATPNDSVSITPSHELTIISAVATKEANTEANKTKNMEDN